MEPALVAVWLAPGSGWDDSLEPREQRLWTEHAAFMDDLFQQGSIVLGGPMADGSGSLVIVQGASAEQVRAWFATDPWTLGDVLPMREITEWTIYLDGRPKPEG